MQVLCLYSVPCALFVLFHLIRHNHFWGCILEVQKWRQRMWLCPRRHSSRWQRQVWSLRHVNPGHLAWDAVWGRAPGYFPGPAFSPRFCYSLVLDHPGVCWRLLPALNLSPIECSVLFGYLVICFHNTELKETMAGLRGGPSKPSSFLQFSFIIIKWCCWSFDFLVGQLIRSVSSEAFLRISLNLVKLPFVYPPLG